MICISREPTMFNEPNKAVVVIQSDTEPAEFPLNGENVTDLDAATAIAPGSILYVVKPRKVYFMNEAGTAWNEFGGA